MASCTVIPERVVLISLLRNPEAVGCCTFLVHDSHKQLPEFLPEFLKNKRILAIKNIERLFPQKQRSINFQLNDLLNFLASRNKDLNTKFFVSLNDGDNAMLQSLLDFSEAKKKLYDLIDKASPIYRYDRGGMFYGTNCVRVLKELSSFSFPDLPIRKIEIDCEQCRFLYFEKVIQALDPKHAPISPCSVQHIDEEKNVTPQSGPENEEAEAEMEETAHLETGTVPRHPNFSHAHINALKSKKNPVEKFGDKIGKFSDSFDSKTVPKTKTLQEYAVTIKSSLATTTTTTTTAVNRLVSSQSLTNLSQIGEPFNPSRANKHKLDDDVAQSISEEDDDDDDEIISVYLREGIGLVLIIAHSENRPETDIDIGRIRRTFEGPPLQCQIELIKDQTKFVIKRELKKIEEIPENAYDFLLMFVIGHGGIDQRTHDDYITVAPSKRKFRKEKDDRFYLEEFEKFIKGGGRLSGLKGKPKILIVQTCRGLKFNMDANPIPSKAAPSFSSQFGHYMILYSAHKDYVSFRHEDDGALMIKRLCELIKKYPSMSFERIVKILKGKLVTMSVPSKLNDGTDIVCMQPSPRQF